MDTLKIYLRSKGKAWRMVIGTLRAIRPELWKRSISIGTGCIIRDNVHIDNGVIIGMNSEIGEGAIIGSFSNIARDSFIPPGIIISSDSAVSTNIIETERVYINKG